MPITSGKGASIPFVAKRLAKLAGGLCRNQSGMAIRARARVCLGEALGQAEKSSLKAWMKSVLRVAICAFPGSPGCAGGRFTSFDFGFIARRLPGPSGGFGGF
jgi:hypothetical protein